MQSMHASLSTTQLQLMHRQSQCSIDLTHDGTMQGIEIYTLINTASMHHFVREWKKKPYMQMLLVSYPNKVENRATY